MQYEWFSYVPQVGVFFDPDQPNTKAQSHGLGQITRQMLQERLENNISTTARLHHSGYWNIIHLALQDHNSVVEVMVLQSSRSPIKQRKR